MTEINGKIPNVIGRIHIVKIAILSKLIFRFNVIPFKLPMTFFTELEWIILKCICNHKRPRIAKAMLRKKKKQSWRHNTPRLQRMPQSYSDQTSMVSAQKQTYESMEQNREPRDEATHRRSINLHQRRQEYVVQWRKDSLFIKWCWESWTAICKSKKLKHSITLYTKINLKTA